ncbi:MAG: DUF4920 domain-containing protein [Myxococcota bacterium]|nr:DUF4920 domain-containing protein [Myxococcota bacterium]
MNKSPFKTTLIVSLIVGMPFSVLATTTKVGNPIDDKIKSTTLAQILKAPKTFENKKILVTEGQVRQVCQKKGCWMELAVNSAAKGAGCRVTFKDYAFFVPKNSMGQHARLMGNIQLKKIDANRVKYLEAEGGTFSQKEKDGSAYEVRFVASGVELSK